MRPSFVLLLLVAFATVPPANAQSLFISPSGNNTLNDCTAAAAPCQDLQAALLQIPNGATSFVIIASPGNYTGPSNFLPLPAIPGTIQSGGTTPAVFDCTDEPLVGFNATHSLTLTNITIRSCDTGVLMKDQNLTMTTVETASCDYGVDFTGEELTISHLIVSGSFSVGVRVRQCTRFYLDKANILFASQRTLYATDLGSSIVTITGSQFETTAPVYLSGDDGTQGFITDCIFKDLLGSPALTLAGGVWQMSNTVVEQCPGVAVYYPDGGSTSGSLSVQDSTIQECSTGIYMETSVPLHLNNVTVIQATQGISQSSVSDLRVEESTFQQCSKPMVTSSDSGSNGTVVITNLTLDRSGTCTLWLTPFEKGVIDTVSVLSPTQTPLKFQGGSWIITGLAVSQGPVATPANGGAVSFDVFAYAPGNNLIMEDSIISSCAASGSGGALYLDRVDFSLRNCTFEGNQATAGGAVYASEFSTGNVINCTFVDNNSTGLGGALDLVVDSSANETAVVDVRDCLFDANGAENGAAVACCDGCDIEVRLVGNTFESNVNGQSEGVNVACNTAGLPANSPSASISAGPSTSLSRSATTSVSTSASPVLTASASSGLTVSPSATTSVSASSAPSAATSPGLTVTPTATPSSSPTITPSVTVTPSASASLNNPTSSPTKDNFWSEHKWAVIGVGAALVILLLVLVGVAFVFHKRRASYDAL